MTASPSFLESWVDRDFWTTGAFLVSEDGLQVTLGKGGITDILDNFPDVSVPIFYLKDFYTESFLAYCPLSFVTISKANMLSWLDGISEAHSPISPVSNDDDLYEKDFFLLKNSFNDQLEKVVLISRETYMSFEGEHTLKRLLKKALHFGTGTPYGFWDKNYGMIGSTPERLVDVKKSTLSTFALAGTARLGMEKELLSSAKDRHEHELVIKDILEKLKIFTTSVKVDETKTHPFKSIVHLKTDITAEVKSDIKYDELINALSPTAALGGYPKVTALKFLQGSNYGRKYSRFFGSAFGVVSDQEAHFVVAIRNVQWQDKHLFIESGGGVVAESDFQKELEEIHLKRDTIRKHYL